MLRGAKRKYDREGGDSFMKRGLWGYYKGLFCEFFAILIYTCMLYRFRGWRIRNKAGEIDLVFSRGSLWIFVEVKYRKSGLQEGLLSSWQLSRIKTAAQLFMYDIELSGDEMMRFDFIVFSNWRLPVIIYNITQ